ncbi:MAG: hypothetical protein LBC51_11285 [Treponema sp.]|nr:hypothetical protein [Treponema sp.]
MLRESRHCEGVARSNRASAASWHSEFDANFSFIAKHRRRKEKLLFDAEDAGMTAYVCIR